jgi:uncharacterized protein with HEPN domain
MNQPRLTARDYMQDMLECCRVIQQFLQGQTLEDFFANRMMQDAILRNLEVLGEAAKQLMDVLPDAPTRFPAIPFRAMYLTRNRLIHGYASIRLLTVWDVANEEIPVVHEAVMAILASWPEDLD